MTNIVMCPTCGGQKTVSKPTFIPGDVNHWVSSGTVSYPCPTCDARGWIDTDTNAELIILKSATLSVMETLENLMDECVHRAEVIKELKARVNDKNMKIIEIVDKCQDRERELEFLVDAMDSKIVDLESQLWVARNARMRSADDSRLLDDILKAVDRVIKRNTAFSHIMNTTYESEQMRDVCYLVAKFYKEHNIKR